MKWTRLLRLKCETKRKISSSPIHVCVHFVLDEKDSGSHDSFVTRIARNGGVEFADLPLQKEHSYLLCVQWTSIVNAGRSSTGSRKRFMSCPPFYSEPRCDTNDFSLELNCSFLSTTEIRSANNENCRAISVTRNRGVEFAELPLQKGHSYLLCAQWKCIVNAGRFSTGSRKWFMTCPSFCIEPRCDTNDSSLELNCSLRYNSSFLLQNSVL